MKIYITLVILVLTSLNYSQNLDSLFNRFMQIRGRNIIAQHVVSNAGETSKCGFGITMDVKKNFKNFTAKQRIQLTSLLSRPKTDTSFNSPSGKFKIHYNKKGADSPAYDVNELAKAADYTYSYEVDILKYLPPPKDSDGIYDIYIQNLGSNLYGITEADSQLTADTYNSYMIVNADYSNFLTSGINAAKVTVAHEFHHAIQMGNYIYRPADSFYHELTSTSMEEILYDNINDYYYYQSSYFSNPGKAMTQNLGYNLAIWNLFLRDRFGVDIIKEIWEKMPTHRAVECFSKVLEKHGSSLLKEFNEFGVWTYFTNTRAIPGQYFKEADKYPKIKAGMQIPMSGNQKTVIVKSEAISNNFIDFIDGSDTLTCLVTNADVQSSINGSGTISFDETISKSQSPGFGQIYNGYYSKLGSESISLLKDSYFFNGFLANKIMNYNYAFPQPFSYSKNSLLNFPAELTSNGTVDLYIYSIDMNMVYSSPVKISNGTKVVVSWNVLDTNGRKLSTGVYFYIVKCGDNILKGKFVVLND